MFYMNRTSYLPFERVIPYPDLSRFSFKRLPATWSFALWIASGVIGKAGVNVPSRDLGAKQELHWKII